MTEQQEAVCRAAFEDWFDAPTPLKRDVNGIYVFMTAYSAWRAWQAAWEIAQQPVKGTGHRQATCPFCERSFFYSPVLPSNVIAAYFYLDQTIEPELHGPFGSAEDTVRAAELDKSPTDATETTEWWDIEHRSRAITALLRTLYPEGPK